MVIMEIEKNFPNVTDFIKVYKNVISEKNCKFIIDSSSQFSWQLHKWGDYKEIVKKQDSTLEFLRSPVTGMSLLLLNSSINNCIENYTKNGTYFSTNGFIPPNLNKYPAGSHMLSHVDHIYSCFDGSIKGIPILSVVGLLNDDFNGGTFNFWDDYQIDLLPGDILIFPSNFMYAHHVKKITSGIRYSFVTWVY